jgi:hypothetical protein
MGAFKHHVIIITGWSQKSLKRARRKARKIFKELVSEIVYTPLNDFWSFFIAPDGSKEGWAESFDYDRRRAAYVAWLSKRPESGGSLDWVEVEYGDEYGRPSAVINDSTPPSEEAENGEIPF